MDESGAGHGSRPQPQPGTSGAPADRISSLSDDVLLQVLSHLGYASDAARTILLCRRWRRLYSHLPELDVTLRDVPLASLEDALRGVARPGMRLLDITVPVQDLSTDVSSTPDPCGKDGAAVVAAATTVSSVLREAARLFPAQLRFALPPNLTLSRADTNCVHLPRLDRATSIDLRAPPYLRLRQSPDSTGFGFPALESLSISGCLFGLDNLIPLCPRLRVLTVATNASTQIDFTVQSFSLRELVVDRSDMPTRNIIMQAPVLQRLTMSFHVDGFFWVSIFAPMVEKISWQGLYAHHTHGIGPWVLLQLTLETTRHGVGTDHTACSQRPHINVLSLHMSTTGSSSFGFPDGENSEFGAEISKHMVTDFSALELHLTTTGHAFGSLVCGLLRIHDIAKATRSLRIILLRSQVRAACRLSCYCHGPSNSRTQLAFLSNLQELEIQGFQGEDHEFEFLMLVLGHAPMLTRLAVRLPDQVTPNDDCFTKLHDIFAAYPSVEASVDVIPAN